MSGKNDRDDDTKKQRANGLYLCDWSSSPRRLAEIARQPLRRAMARLEALRETDLATVERERLVYTLGAVEGHVRQSLETLNKVFE